MSFILDELNQLSFFRNFLDAIHSSHTCTQLYVFYVYPKRYSLLLR